MSSKSSFLKKFRKDSAQVKTAPAVRSIEDITKEYNELRAKVSDAQYNAYVYKLETENLNRRMLSLNQEAAERKRLDAESASTEVKNG